jgi:phage tail sheath protein FI
MSTPRPGVSIIQRSTPPPRSTAVDTGVWFVTGLTDAGPLSPVLIGSMADYERIFGLRTAYSVLYDALDTYFREGGARAYISRIVGPAAVVASKNLLDAGAGISLVVTALGPGSFYNAIKVGVRAGGAGGTFVLFVQDSTNTEVETSPDLASQAAAVLWSANSSYIRVALGVTALNPAVVAAGALAAGADDRTNITDAQRQAAIDRFTSDLGIGQVSEPGNTTDTAHTRLLAHAYANRRSAILDAPDTPTVGTLKTSASAARAGNQRFGGMWWPWNTAPGYVAGTTRSVPPSALVAAICARNDARGVTVSDPGAGDNGVAQFVYALSQPAVDDTTRQQLNDAGVNVIRSVFTGVRVYGWRSLVDPIVDPEWRSFGTARLYMSIAGEGANIAETFLFDKIDGQGKKIAEFNGALSGMLQRYWNRGDLYGATALEAFFVDTGDQVNTPARIANNELHAVLNVKMAPFAEFVQIEIVKRAISESVQ